jgi:hypothetical protein
MDILNLILAALSIGLGLFGWLAPQYTMSLLDMQAGTTSMAISEVRAASGALFIGLGAGAIWLGTPTAYAMMGMAWGGAAVGRLTSVLVDGATPQKLTFLAVEATFAAVVLWINLRA